MGGDSHRTELHKASTSSTPSPPLTSLTRRSTWTPLAAVPAAPSWQLLVLVADLAAPAVNFVVRHMTNPTRLLNALLVIFVAAIAIALLMSPTARWLALYFLAPFIQLLLGPAIITTELFHIVHQSFYIAALASLLSIVLLRKWASNIYRKLVILFGVFWLIHTPYSIHLGEARIRSIASNKYSTEAHEVNVNLGGWYKLSEGNHMGLPGHDRHLGEPHGYIYRDGKECNWSFIEDDFVCPVH